MIKLTRKKRILVPMKVLIFASLYFLQKVASIKKSDEHRIQNVTVTLNFVNTCEMLPTNLYFNTHPGRHWHEPEPLRTEAEIRHFTYMITRSPSSPTGRCQSPHFTHAGAETRRGEITCPSSHS